MIIGVTGPIASGTDKLGEILKPLGFSWLSYSDVIREVAAERGFPTDRKGLQDLGDILRKEKGTGFLSVFLIEKMKKLEGSDFVVGNIRNPGEVDVLREEFGDDFVLVKVDAPQKVRFERLLKRGREGDPKTYEDFLRIEERDLGSKEEEHGQKHGAVFDMADHVVGNEGSERLFRKRVGELMEKIKV
jgi:dCMP deaminase